MGVFIEILLDNRRLASEVRSKLASLCPVDIFRLEGEQLVVRPEQVDECTLCELCLDAAPAGALTIRKNYMNESLVSRGPEE